MGGNALSHFGAAAKEQAKQAIDIGVSSQRISRITRVMAVAIKFDKQIRQSAFRDIAEIARVGHVTRARMTQIMNLLNLAPDIQEQLIEWREAGRRLVCERQLWKVAAPIDWTEQRRVWRRLSGDQIAG